PGAEACLRLVVEGEVVAVLDRMHRPAVDYPDVGLDAGGGDGTEFAVEVLVSEVLADGPGAVDPVLELIADRCRRAAEHGPIRVADIEVGTQAAMHVRQHGTV